MGIRAHLQTEDYATYSKDARTTNKFQVSMIGWNGDNGDPDDWLGIFFAKYDPTNAYLSYNNSTVLDLIRKAKVETSQARRAQMYAQAETMIINDYRDIPIAYAPGPLVMQKNVRGLIGQPAGNEYLETVEIH